MRTIPVRVVPSAERSVQMWRFEFGDNYKRALQNANCKMENSNSIKKGLKLNESRS
jgi:hypothetical protein